ncbi:hypothetical protein GCM10025794_36320 [Massilia kyonggiensis]|jgi:hypothetical protein
MQVSHAYLNQSIEMYRMGRAMKSSDLRLRREGIIIEMEVSEDGWPEESAQ